ncbi:PLD nuclease N-terminal domain-containing protein [Streptomyces ovatisporus]|uniref:PLD nuclease N-terminal domain-containing protein n=1 Tax=Streptomyces ovatisporus TaxID=1128682 RepID=A0ABV9ACC5_9ACTN
MLRYLPFILVLAVWIYAFIDCLNTPEKEVRKLPKVVWVIVILLFGQVLLGPIAWFAVGRPRRNAPYGATRPDERRWVAPDDNPEFLKSLDDGAPPRGPQSDGGRSEPGSDAGSGRTFQAGTDDTPPADGGERGTNAEPAPGPAPADGAADSTSKPDPARQEAELRRREEESRHRDNGTDEPPQTR